LPRSRHRSDDWFNLDQKLCTAPPKGQVPLYYLWLCPQIGAAARGSPAIESCPALSCHEGSAGTSGTLINHDLLTPRTCRRGGRRR